MLDVGEQGRLGRDQPAGGDEALVPAGIESDRGSGQRPVQLAEDGAGQLAVGQRGQVRRPQLGLGLDRRGLLGREEAEEGALRDLRFRSQVLQRRIAEPVLGEQPQRRVGERATGPQLLPLTQRQGPVCGRGNHAAHPTKEQDSEAYGTE